MAMVQLAHILYEVLGPLKIGFIRCLACLSQAAPVLLSKPCSRHRLTRNCRQTSKSSFPLLILHFRRKMKASHALHTSKDETHLLANLPQYGHGQSVSAFLSCLGRIQNDLRFSISSSHINYTLGNATVEKPSQLSEYQCLSYAWGAHRHRNKFSSMV
jgi:hypothetical protein